MPLRELERGNIPHAQREASMRLDRSRGFRHRGIVVEEQGLRQLDDRMVAQPGQRIDPKILMRFPDRSEITAAMQENRPAGQVRFQVFGSMRLQRAAIGDRRAVPIEKGAFAHPDR